MLAAYARLLFCPVAALLPQPTINFTVIIIKLSVKKKNLNGEVQGLYLTITSNGAKTCLPSICT